MICCAVNHLRLNFGCRLHGAVGSSWLSGALVDHDGDDDPAALHVLFHADGIKLASRWRQLDELRLFVEGSVQARREFHSWSHGVT